MAIIFAVKKNLNQAWGYINKITASLESGSLPLPVIIVMIYLYLKSGNFLKRQPRTRALLDSQPQSHGR